MAKKFSTRKVFVLLFVLFAAFVSSAFANESANMTTGELQPPPPPRGEVTGQVFDENGAPMPGVSIIVEGTNFGTTSDVNGNFRLNNVPGNGTLKASFIGYKDQIIDVEGRRNLQISMVEDAELLDEVVVIGYGTMKKSDLTGSVSSISADKLTSIGTSSVMSALQGAAPGVDISQNSTRPGAGFNIEIRGQNTMGSNSGPLYVVDGIITSDIDFLNPSDIERVDILKDASSTAIYGSRGSNGVVIVQTKGSSNVHGRISVSYDGFYGIRDITRIPDFMDGREWTDFRTSRYYTQADGVYAITSNNKTAVTQNSRIIHENLYNETYTDWLDLATRTGSQQNHYVNVAGSGAGISYTFGGGYQKEEGNFIEEELNRYTLKGSITHKASKWFMAGANFSLSHQIVNSGSQYGYRDVLRMPVVLNAYDAEGNLIPQPGISAVIEGAGNFTSSANPLLEIASGSNETRRFDVLGNIFFQIDPIEGLSLKTTFAPRLNRQRIGYYRDVVQGNRSVNQAQNSQRETLEWTWDNQITYAKTFNGKHNLNATYIFSMYQSQYEILTVTAEDFPYDSKWYKPFNGTVQLGSSSGNWTQVSMVSNTGRVNYDYMGKYFVTGTVRYDGSSKLGDGHKWKAFPSAALGWRVSEEPFMQGSSKWLDNLKLRLSFGYSGNNNGVSAYGTLASPGGSVYYDFDGNLVTGFASGSPTNTALTWEKTREWNLGVDFSLLKGRISGSVDLYDKLSDGLIMSRQLAIESGVSSMTDNIGSVNNKGIEVALTTRNVQSGDWSWTTTFSFSSNKNEIKELFGKKDDVPGSAWFIGQPINVIYDYKVLGLYNSTMWNAMSAEERTKMGANAPGFPVIENSNWRGEANDKIDTNDRKILGSTDPDWIGSFTSTLKWRNLDFSFNIYTRQGSYVSDRFLEEFGVAANSQRGRPKVNANYYVPGGIDRIDWNNWDTSGSFPMVTWKTSEETMNAEYPMNGFTGSFYGNNGRYQDTSFVKVRNITLGYTFPTDLISKAKLSYLRVYFNVLNPFTFTDYVGWDPEYATTTLQNGNGPSTVTYQFGVNLKF